MRACPAHSLVVLWLIAATLGLSTATCKHRGVGGDAPDPCECGPCAESEEACLRCGDGFCDRGESPASCPPDCRPMTEVDMLLVIDNSGGDGNAAPFYEQFQYLVEGLRLAPDGVPSLHVGVITTDVSIGPNAITYCDDPDDGRLVGADTLGTHLYGGRYLVDARPTECAVQRTADGTCVAHDCGPDSCAEQHTVLQEDPLTGCPRCRNFHDISLGDAIMSSTWVGTLGCGLEQPLEAMRLALDDHPENVGFLREDSLLVVWFYTPEDNTEPDMALALTSFCAVSHASTFLSLGHRIAQHTTDATLTAP